MKRFTALLLLLAPQFCLAQSLGVRTDFVPLGSILVQHKDGTVNAYGLGAASDIARGTALEMAIGAAAATDKVVIGPGGFDVVTSQIHAADGVTIQGAGIDKTTIYSQRSSAQTSSVLLPWSNGGISDFTLNCNNPTTQQSPIGVRTSDNPSGTLTATNWTAERIKGIAAVDFVHTNDASGHTASTIGWTFRNCQFFSQFDTIALFGPHSTGSYMTFDNCTCAATFGSNFTYPSYAGSIGATCRCLADGLDSSLVTIKVIGGDFTVGGASGVNNAFQTQNSSTGSPGYRLLGPVRITSSGTSAADLNAQAGTISVDPAVQYNTGKTSGTITLLPAWGTTPTTTGLAAVGATNAAALANAAGASAGVFPVTAGGTGAATLTGLVKGNGTSAMTAATAGTDYIASLVSPGPIGGTTPSTGAFTTLSASSTVSGTGFSTYLASPPAIGGTSAAAGSFTTITASGRIRPTSGNEYDLTQNGAAIGGNRSAVLFDSGGGGVLTLTGGLNFAAFQTDVASDLTLTRDAANTLAQRNGANAQAFRLYNTYTDGSNFEYGGMNWASNALKISTQNAGTGTARNITFSPGNTLRMQMTASTGVISFPSLATTAPATANGLYNDGGFAAIDSNVSNDLPIQEKVVASNFSKTTNTTLADITGLTAKIGVSGKYRFRAVLHVTADATGGHKYTVHYDDSGSTVIYQITSTNNSSNAEVITSRRAVFDTADGQAGATSAYTVIEGFIQDANNAGTTLSIQFAENASSGTSSVLAGSTLEVVKIP